MKNNRQQLEAENAGKRKILREAFGMREYQSHLPLEVEAIYLDYLIEFETLLAVGQIILPDDGVVNPAMIVGQNPVLLGKWQRLEREFRKLGIVSVVGKM